MVREQIVLLAIAVSLGSGLARAGERPAEDAEGVVRLFNGKDLSNFYTFLKDRGRDTDPNEVFTVDDGVLRISGQDWGCITTNDEFENYRLTVEFKWGEKTWGDREHAARDSGVLVHSVGEDGGYNGTWMHSIEVQMIEGGTGDFIVVGDKSEDFAITCPVEDRPEGKPLVYQPGGKDVTIHSGRVDWFGRDPGWKDVKGFRGARDVEKPVGEWNTLEIIAQGNTITTILNGVTVNSGKNAKPTKGRIQIQSEGAELFVRRVDLQPLGR
ncbi:MAG: hypothetical protein AMXMBFR4_06300 [Candidatus Hydrogenedentota bacterium]